MASSDTISPMLQRMKQMQKQQRAADEHQRQSMAAILKRRVDQTLAATRSTIEKSPPIKIERAMTNQYERLESEKSAGGSRAMLSARGHRRNDNPPIRCPPLLPHRTLCLEMPRILDKPP